MADVSVRKDEGEASDGAERCLQQLKQLPQIMDLLGQEKPPASQLRDSFETLSQIIQQVADSLPEHNSTVLDVMHKILHVHTSHVYRALSGCNSSALITSALNLLVAMVTYSQQAARDVIAAFNFQHGVFTTLVNRTDLKVEDDIRSCCLRLAMSFFVSADNRVIKQMLTNKDFLKSFFKKLSHDRASNIKLLLVTLTQHLVCNPAVSKTEKLHILNNYTLQQVATLYKWQGVTDTKLEAPSEHDADFQALEMRQLCHQFLLKVTCDLKHGINFFDSYVGLSGKNCNPVLLKFLLSLPCATDDEMILALVVNILHVCPDLLNPYLSTCKLSFQPRPSSSWLINMKLLKEILSGQSVIPSALQQRKVPTSQVAHLAMTTTVPSVLTPALLSQAVKHSSSIVSYCILDIIKLIVRRAGNMIEWFRETEQTAVLSQYQQTLLKVLPDVDTYVNLVHKILGRPLDAEQSHQISKRDEPAHTESLGTDTDQANPVTDILPLILDVLCAYQRTIPQTFAQTLYDFSRLPHLIHYAESISQLSTAERAFALLLAFPEGKLRGFKEVKGDDGSTVLLLLKQLTSASAKSDLHTLKIKLLHKLMKETGLFAQTAWEIRVWLDILAEFSQDEDNQVVKSFYKALTQAIRNPYPFNDHVIDAMSTAHAVLQSGYESIDTRGALSPDDLASIADTASCDLDGGDITASSTDRPSSEAAGAKPLPCSALLPSALQIFAQLECPSRNLFGQYVSSVALSVLDAQEDPTAMCLLLHRYTQTEGSNIQQDTSWQYVMKYYAIWLPTSYRQSDWHKSEVPLPYQDIDKTRSEWTIVLHTSILQGIALSDRDMTILLQCDKEVLLQVSRQLLMYVHTLHSIHPKKVVTVLPSYLLMLQNILGRVHSGDCLRGKDDSLQLAENAVGEDSTLSVSGYEATDEWWTAMATLTLKHAAFCTWLGRDAASRPITSAKLHALNPAVAASFLKCLSLFKLHLPEGTLEPLLQPIVRDSFQSFFNLLAERVTTGGKTKTKREDELFRTAVQLFEELCAYGEDLPLSEAVRSLLGTLKDQTITAASLGKKQQLLLKASLCHLLEIVAKRPKGSQSQQLPKPTGITEALSVCDMSLFVELAHKFNCDQMIRILSQLLEDNLQWTTLITDSIFTAWLDDPSEAKCYLLSLLVKNSREHLEKFDDWCQHCSTHRLRDSKSLLLPVVHSYCSQRSLSTGNQTISILHATYWSWLEQWILHHDEQEDTNECDQIKLSILTHLLNHSTDKAVFNYLRNCIGNEQDKHSTSFNRFLLKTCQLSAEKLASRDLDEETQDILQGVIVACLHSFINLIKINSEDLASEVNDHLLTISAIVKTVEAKVQPVSAPLIHVWKSLVRNGLKHHFKSAATLQLIASLVKVIYGKLSRNDATRDGKPDSARDGARNLLPLSVLYQIVLSHSLFLPTLLEGQDGDNGEVKESLVKLMLTIVELDPLCCHESHYAVLIGGYNATMSLADSVILSLMQHYQLNQAFPASYKLSAWGHAAVSQYQTQKALGKSLWQQPSMKEILHQLDVDALRDSALHFPLHRKLQTPYDPSAGSISSELYDPCFLLPLFSQLLATECLVDCLQFIESNAFALTVAGLSSFDISMRGAAYHIVASFLEHLEGARFRGRREVYYLLQCLKNSICEPNMRIPCVLNVFVSRAAGLMLTPESFMYPTILQYLLIKPRLQTEAVPMFSRLFYSSGFKHEEECCWMLSLLQDGLRVSSDVILYETSSVFTTLTACYQSVLASKQCKDAMLSLFNKAFDVEQTKESVTRQLRPCLQAAKDLCCAEPFMRQATDEDVSNTQKP